LHLNGCKKDKRKFSFRNQKFENTYEGLRVAGQQWQRLSGRGSVLEDLVGFPLPCHNAIQRFLHLKFQKLIE